MSSGALATIVAGMTTGSALPAEGDSFQAPTPEEFYQPIFHIGSFVVTRPMVLTLIAAVLIGTWLVLSTWRMTVIPSKGQHLTEQAYDFVRNGIARDMIGSHDFLKFTPVLFALFLYILVNNLFGSMPFTNFPAMSRIGMPLGLVLIVYVLYHLAGIQKRGLAGYFKFLLPPGLPKALAPAIFLLELMTFFITRPLTLTLRLFGNMFAGHMLMGVFILGGTYLVGSGNLGLMAAGVGSFGMGALMQALELLIQALQAYVFTMLAASYFGGAVAEDH